MKAALIPPKGYEATALMSNIHLVLPLTELIWNSEYVDTYRQARKRGDYIILDNGAAEAQLVDGSQLMSFANTIGAHEVVAPDIMGNASKTYDATVEFLKDFPQAEDYSIMGVVQGQEFADRTRLARSFNSIDAITTLGIPKIHISRGGSPMRLRLVEHILYTFPGRFKIHLLGLSSSYPTEVRDLDFPKEVRSIDSALPYKATEDGLPLATKNVSHSKRRKNYFTKTSFVQTELLEQNVNTFMQWARHNEG